MGSPLTEGNDGSPPQLIRHQFGNHLGSASLELDANAQVISYEEYTPYGSTSYQAVNKAIKAAAKRYRYTGKERDEETGYTYHGARYYAAWLGRWISCDPAGLAGGINSFTYGLNNPIKLIDPNGKDCVIPQQCAGDAMNDPAKVEAARYFLSMPVSKAMKEFGFKSSDDYNKFVGFLKQQGLTPRSVGAVDPSNKGQTQIGVDTNYHSQKQAYQDFQNAGNSVLASATYEGATAAGASPELRSNLTQLSSNVSDVAQVAAQTANARAQTKTAGKAVPDARKKVGGAPVDNTPTTTPVFDGLTKQEVDKAVDAAKGGTAFALPGQNPKTGEGLLNHVPNATATTNPEARISHADESTFTGIQGAGGKQVEFRRHSADKEAPSGKYALNNPVTVVNTVKSTPSGVLKLSPNGHTYKDRYLDPNGSFIKPKTDSQWDSVHHH
ncbi:MAG: RHS repeat-associated core domain-containing protein [Methylococcaceae bacterium]